MITGKVRQQVTKADAIATLERVLTLLRENGPVQELAKEFRKMTTQVFTAYGEPLMEALNAEMGLKYEHNPN